ncbi:DUF167 domain-containing protein [Hymenobacter sp. AT01-02]|uniref:DUF167 domain-containing protein n=1 Tax=Hymenobacter sp. AT01-02 TaxID=1571877 RepID=UPI0005F131C5|nr:DUF167 domain-containing protein [Hymenobacter sp. AT01-02]
MPVLHLKAKPNARTTQLVVGPDGSITVRLQAPAHDGKANACLLAYLAEVFGVSKSSVTLLSGHTAPFKKVEITDLTEQAFQAALQPFRQ